MMPSPYVPVPATTDGAAHSSVRIAADAVHLALAAIGAGHLFPRDAPEPGRDDQGRPVVQLGYQTAEEAAQFAALLRGLAHPPPVRGGHS